MSRPRAVGFVTPSLAHGGAERVLVEQVRALAPWGVPVDVWALRGAGFEHLAPAVRAAGPHVREVAVVPSTARLVLRLLRRRPGVVVTYHAPRAYRALLRLRRVPLAPRPVVFETVHERYRWALEPFGGLRPRALDAAVLTHDVRAAARAAFGLPDDRLFVARPLFPASLLPVGAEAAAAARAWRQARGIPPEAAVVGYLGRLGDNKGLLPLVGLVADLAGRGHDVHLVLAGRACPELTGFPARLDAAVAAAGASPSGRGRFHLLGEVADAAAAYAGFDVLVLLSRTEGLLPLSLVEAMSCGVPVVTTDVGGIGTCLRDGLDAEVVRKVPDDEADLSPPGLADAAARLERLVRDPARRAALGAAGRARVRDLVAAADFGAETRAAVEGAYTLGPRGPGPGGPPPAPARRAAPGDP